MSRAETMRYEPEVFLRCHCYRNNPKDSETQIWRAEFEPRKSSKFVATCGANIVCLIDCHTLKVAKRFIDSNQNEQFFALSLTLINDQTIVAVAGAQKEILLLGPDSLLLRERIPNAHDREINALLFHTSQPNHLFSGGYDKRVKLWEISMEKSSELLMTIETDLKILNLCYSLEHNSLLISGENGLKLFYDMKVLAKFIISPKTKQLTDGICILDSNRFVMRQTKTDVLFIVNLRDSIEQIKNGKLDIELSRATELELEWTNTNIDYINLASRNSIVVCGDDDGKLYIYKIGKKSVKRKVIDWPILVGSILERSRVILINSVAISDDLQYIVAVTNVNLVCIWKRRD